MNDDPLADGLARLPRTGLADLDSVASLLTRRDRKYVLALPEAARLVELLPRSTRVLTIDSRRSFRYESVYFDTPNLETYFAAARRRPGRYKVRTRAYVDAGPRVLEIKHRDRRGRTVKLRTDHGATRPDVLDERSLVFLAAYPFVGELSRALRATLRVAYVRSTLLLDDGSRLTVDVDVRSTTPDGRAVVVPGLAVIETKSPLHPSKGDRILWLLGHRPIRISKFCASLAVLHPELPSNRWMRVLQRRWLVATDHVPISAAG